MRQICRFRKGALVVANGDIWTIESGAEPRSSLKTSDRAPTSACSIATSADGGAIALLVRKKLAVYDATTFEETFRVELPRAASEIRFAPNSRRVLVADKTGDGHLVDAKADGEKPVQIVGHSSMLLDILMSDDEKHVITCDRDEKIKVFRYPQTFEIRSVCLGHREFVMRLDTLPHDGRYLVSASGDGAIKIWNYSEGKEVLSIDANEQSESDSIASFKRSMKNDDIEVEKLPINHMACCRTSERSSLIAVSNYSVKCLILYTIETVDSALSCRLYRKVNLDDEPSSFAIDENKLWIYFRREEVYVQEWDLKNLDREVSTHKLPSDCGVSEEESDETGGFLTLYKRKFDNVQEYQMRKKKRLESTKI